MAYLGEFRLNWPNLLGACLGLALGSALNHYMINLFGPPLIDEFGWARSEFALVVAVSLVGLAQGAEGDVGAYLTSRKFSIQHYSFIYSFLIASMGASSAIGALVLSLTLHLTNSLIPFLVLCAVVTLFGALCFYLTGRYGKVEDAKEEEQPGVELAAVIPASMGPTPNAPP